MPQLLCHICGDYILQSDWMALNKSKRSWPCLVHVLLYTSCFLFLTTSWKALLVIGATHFILDRFPVILKRIIWLKNHFGPWFWFVPFSKCNATGYYDNIINEVNGKPFEGHHCKEWYNNETRARKFISYEARLNYITIWLYIITDNFFHLLINYLALTHL
jgi:hypothetical protein